MIITHKLEMDLCRRDRMPGMDAVQGDANTRVLELTLFENGTPWNIPEGASVWMRFCRSDGVKGIYDTLPDGTAAWAAEENVLSVTLTPQMLAAAGTVLAQIELVQGSASVASFPVQITVERNVAADVVGMEDYVNMLQWMQAELDSLLAEARDSGDFDGPQGPQGPQGEPGLSAYEQAAAAGYPGTEAEFAAMLNTPCLPLSGGTMTGFLDMGGQVLTGLAAPENDTDAATKTYVDDKRITGIVMARLTGWSEEAPYTQAITVAAIRGGEWIRMEPVYTVNLEADLAAKADFDCISYVIAMEKQLYLVCLEKKPEADMKLYVEAIR